MSACETCWAEASRRALLRGGSTADRYREVLAEQERMGREATCREARLANLLMAGHGGRGAADTTGDEDDGMGQTGRGDGDTGASRAPLPPPELRGEGAGVKDPASMSRACARTRLVGLRWGCV